MARSEMSLPRIAALAFFSSLALACSRPEAPALTPQVARVAQVSPAGLVLDLELKVDNPNDFAIYAQLVTGTVYLGDGQKLGDGTSRPGQAIPAQGAAVVPSRMHVAWQNLPVLAPLLMRDVVPYTFRGDVALGSEDFNVTLPFTLTGQLTRADLLAAGLRGF